MLISNPFFAVACVQRKGLGAIGVKAVRRRFARQSRIENRRSQATKFGAT